MAKNDVVLIDEIVDERLREVYPSNQCDEVFEFLAFEQVLKDFDLSREEIEAGWVDGRDDGGIDGFFVFVNGHLLQDVLTVTGTRGEDAPVEGTDLLERVLAAHNLRRALHQVRRHQGAPGIDGRTVDDLEAHLKTPWPTSRAAWVEGS
jgi:hypothetical protein